MNRPFQFIGLESWSLIPITCVLGRGSCNQKRYNNENMCELAMYHPFYCRFRMVGLSYPDGISQGGYFNTRLGSSTQ